MLENQNILLRVVEPDDLDFLYSLENNPENWLVSNTSTPFSKATLKQYVESVHDIETQKQLRLIITDGGNRVGALDLFEFEPIHQRVGIGLVVLDEFRRNGIARTAIELALGHCFNTLNVSQVWCNILQNNTASLALFEGIGFVKMAEKKHWVKSNGSWLDEYMYQLIKE